MQIKAADDKQPDLDALAGPRSPRACDGAGLTWSH